jgi:hypothetical protein
MGSIILKAVRNGWCEKANVPNQKSHDPKRHGHPETVWRSLLRSSR